MLTPARPRPTPRPPHVYGRHYAVMWQRVVIRHPGSHYPGSSKRKYWPCYNPTILPHWHTHLPTVIYHNDGGCTHHTSPALHTQAVTLLSGHPEYCQAATLLCHCNTPYTPHLF